MTHQQQAMTPGVGAYKDEPTAVAGDPHHSHHPQQGTVPQHIQHPRPSSIAHQHQHPHSPHQPSQNHHPGAFPSPHSSNHGLPLHSPYAQPGPGPNGQPPPEVAYYTHQSPYGAPASGPYSAPEAPELMAAAHMQRPYPQVYHTPQSNSPASVASSQSHDQHGRLYGQPPSQIPPGMYGYPQYPPMSQVHASAYPQHPAQHPAQQQPQPHMTSQPLLMSHQQSQPPMQHQPPQSQPSGMTNSPRPKLEPSGMQPSGMQQRPLDPASLPRPPSGPMSSSQNTPTGPQSNGNGLHNGPPSGGVNPNAAPGPIPATTPLVVRQDGNGVQWIAFEYSRDRVKMEYTIRCDVESVNVEQLAAEFRTENCVYPRACCNKDQYRGNRLIYETECNTVGWALAELNPCLRGKRGLIQRAVDSWRNSNQDPRLRSRRVRRMAKINNRKQVSATQPNHQAGPGAAGGPTGVPPSTNSMGAPSQRPLPSNNIGIGGPQLHHHHAHPDGSTTGSADDVSASGDFDGQRQSVSKTHSHSSPNDVRQSQVFHGYPNFPSNHNVGAAMAPSLTDNMEALAGHNGSAQTAVAASVPKTEEEDRKHSLFGDLPEAKRRKFILVDDPDRNSRVRVRVMLDQVNMKELPDQYRKTNSVYPRSYFPIQMQSPPSSARGNRFFEDDDPEGGAEDDDQATRGRTMVPVPMLDGVEGEVAVPKIGRAKKGKEIKLNDLGYRMNWSQSRVFAGRTMFLQRALDAYRNKMRSTITSSGQDASTVALHLETRVGKRRWQERKKRSKRQPGTP